MKIGISNDHAGVELKKEITKYLNSLGHEVINYGTDIEESCDYPDIASKLCAGYKNNEFERGIAICGTGVGISIACNKHLGIRACCCSETESAKLSRQHNNANIVCFGARIIDTAKAIEIVDIFVKTDFSNDERHIRRISQIKDIEDKQLR